MRFAPTRLLVTGGAGFIGSHFIRFVLNSSEFAGSVVNLDALTYAGRQEHLGTVPQDFRSRYTFVHGDIGNRDLVVSLLQKYDIDTVVNFAAESHVDRSIHGPEAFVQTNVLGTSVLLEACRQTWSGRLDVRYHQVSTDEVYGSLGPEGASVENSPWVPRSPYSASKASADLLVRAWYHTYGLPVTLSHASNNYGPYQHPEKLIPRTITRLLAGETVPVYGDGSQIRDWLYVDDHVRGVWAVLTQGRPGEAYNLGGGNQWRNLDLVRWLARRFAALQGVAEAPLLDLITFVADRPGHDQRYALDTTKARRELGWAPEVELAEGMDRTLRWYLGRS